MRKPRAAWRGKRWVGWQSERRWCTRPLCLGAGLNAVCGLSHRRPDLHAWICNNADTWAMTKFGWRELQLGSALGSETLAVAESLQALQSTAVFSLSVSSLLYLSYLNTHSFSYSRNSYTLYFYRLSRVLEKCQSRIAQTSSVLAWNLSATGRPCLPEVLKRNSVSYSLRERRKGVKPSLREWPMLSARILAVRISS